jgi:hypothetical protein
VLVELNDEWLWCDIVVAQQDILGSLAVRTIGFGEYDD